MKTYKFTVYYYDEKGQPRQMEVEIQFDSQIEARGVAEAALAGHGTIYQVEKAVGSFFGFSFGW